MLEVECALRYSVPRSGGDAKMFDFRKLEVAVRILLFVCMAVLACLDHCGAVVANRQVHVRDLQAPTPDVRRHAAVQLGRLGKAEAVEALIAALADTDASVRREAAKSLGLIRAPAAAGVLLRALRDKDKNVRANAAYALGEIRALQTAEALACVLNDPEWCVREQAAWALREVRSPATAVALVNAIAEPDADLAQITWILKGCRDPQVQSHLVRMMSVEEAQVRRRAVEVMTALQPEKLVDALVPVLKDADAGVRLAVVNALAAARDERVEDILRVALKRETDAAVRAALEAAVVKVSRIESLSAHWSFDDRSTTTARDVTGGGTDGQIKGCTPVKGKVGHALRFGEGKYIELGKPPALNIGNSPFTVMAWVFAEAPNGVVVARGGAFCGYSLYVKDGVARFGIHRVEDGPTYIAKGRRSVVGEWTHVAGVVRQDGIDRYVNGALETTTKTPGCIPGNCGQGMEIGFDVANSPAEITDHFEGIIDEVKTFDAALNAEDMARAYRAAK